VMNLLKCGIKNAVAVEGTNVPDEIKELTKEKTTIVFVDGDRGGELIAKEILQTCEVDFVARAPPTREVEELPHKLVMKCLKNKLTADQFVSQLGINISRPESAGKKQAPRDGSADFSFEPSGGDEPRTESRPERPQREERRDDRRDDRRDGGRSDDRRGGRDGDRGRGREGGRGGDRGERSEGRSDDRRGGRDGDRGRGREGGRGGDRGERSEGGRGRGGERRDERPRRDEAPVEAREGEAPAEAAAPAPRREGDPRAAYREQLAGLSGTLKAVLLDDTGNAVQSDLAVRELADTLKGAKDSVHAVVFDGVITQRLLDIAAERKIATVVGVKMGNVTKVPDTVEILTRDDLK
ncbi:MAG: toprim domain-containing protein, partial [Thermoplasmatota archaeon]